MAQLALYHYDGCFACMRVRNAMARMGVVIEERNILAEPKHAEELKAATGRRGVPVLRIDDGQGEVRWLAESRDIIAYLKAHFGDKYPDERPAFASYIDWSWIAPWVLLVLGGGAPAPYRHEVWAVACGLMAFRSFRNARATHELHHWMMGGLFVLVGMLLLLEGLELVAVPWWHAFYGAVALVMGGHVVSTLRERQGQ
jgi:glutathione S-transferase